ncbi:Hypothetical protein CAP_8249 [Chondromyces apiculatus DSM 436]|uniref:NACHT domain-containing protein n=2 Tax=Chondromyces apiculatus TaxID=51 RepID=A0A017TEM6_9BACT|nr:Hypothetical protein CAP_8249 [Chondromyces apiculatus DSM 436]
MQDGLEEKQGARPLRWLHLSELRLGAGDAEGGDAIYGRLVRAFAEGGPFAAKKPDLVFCTGDVALSGKPEQYRAALRFFEELARVTGVPAERIFVVPGNHDMDRARVSTRFSLSLEERRDAEAFFGAAGGEDREIALRRFQGFSAFLREGFGVQLSGEQPYLLARCEVAGRRVSVLGFNSAWLAHEEGMKGHLVVGERLVRQGLAALAEEGDGQRPDLRVALMHHPLGWLHEVERVAVRDALVGGVDFLLHTRPHGEPTVLAEGTGGAVILAAGGVFRGAGEPGVALLVEVDGEGTRVEALACVQGHGEGHRRWVRPEGGTVRLPWRARELRAGGRLGGGISGAALGTYLRRLENETRWAMLIGLSSGVNALRIRLDQVFVPLAVQELGVAAGSEAGDEDGGARGREGPGGEGGGPEGMRATRAGVVALWQRAPFLAVVGGPGSGKTTLLRHLAHLGARAFAGDGEARAELLLEGQAAPLPLLIALPQIAALMPEGAGAGELVAAIAAWAERERGLPEGWLREALRGKQVALFADGLDEIPDLAHRQRMTRALVALSLEIAARQGPGRVMVTTRPAGYGGGVRLKAPFAEAQLLDLEEAEVERFVTRWVQAAARVPEGVRLDQHPEVAGKVSSLLETIRASEALTALAGQPLLLTEIALVHHRRGHIPEQRALLYEAVLEVLLRPFERHAHFRPAVVRGALSAVAWHLMEVSAPEDLRQAEQLEVLAGVVARRLVGKGTHEELESDAALGEQALALLEAQAREAGILQIDGDHRCRFAHRTLQEYLAAVQLTDLPEAELQEVVCARVDEPSFRETLRLAVGILAAHRPGALSRLLGALSGSPELPLLQRARGAAGAASLLADVAMFDLEPFLLAPIRRERDAMLGVLEDGRSPEPLRVGVGEALGRVGDPRLIEERRWVEVPEGPFFRGAPADDEQAMEDEKPGHVVPWLPRILVQRWPVTIEEFSRFVEDRGYEASAFWTEEGWAFRCREGLSAPEGWAVQRQGAWNAPVTGMSFWEAEAYCRWLDRRRRPAQLPEGWVVRLPTESEWEKAARGGLELDEGQENPHPERRYPWGGPWNTHLANTGFRFQRVTPVGCFPGGEGPYGAWDQAGNVWEWCADWYDPGAWEAYVRGGPGQPALVALDAALAPEMPILDAQGSTVRTRCRVLRGGGWGISALIARVSYRGQGEPWRRDGVTGLRCVAGPPLP